MMLSVWVYHNFYKLIFYYEGAGLDSRQGKVEAARAAEREEDQVPASEQTEAAAGRQ